MWHRALLTALALTYLICVLSLSGVQKEDIDVNTLKKLKQHNVHLDDLNNDKIHRDCLANSDAQLARDKQGVNLELTTAPMRPLPMMTERTTRSNQEANVAEVQADIAKIMKYFNVPVTKTTRRLDTDVANKMTTVTDDTTIDRSEAKNNNTLLDTANMMKFWTMYSNFQQSQLEMKNKQNNTTAILPKVEQNTEKNNVIHITINKYTRNESFLEQYFADHRNNSRQVNPNPGMNHIMQKIYDFVSKKLFTHGDDASETTNLDRHETNQEYQRTSKLQVDKTDNLNQTMDKEHEITKTVLNKIPPMILEEIAKEVQGLIIRGPIKNPVTSHTETVKANSDVKNNISEKETVNGVLLQNIMNDVKKMLLSELRQESAFKGSEYTSTANAVTATEARKGPTVLSTSVDPELNKFIKLFKKFKSWKDTSSSSSNGEGIESELSYNHLENLGVTNKPHVVTASKMKGRTKTGHRDTSKSLQVKDSDTQDDTLNSYGYQKHDEENVIMEDEDQTMELPEIFPLPYMLYSSKNKEIRPDIPADGSAESASLDDPPPRNEKRHVKKHQASKNMPHVLEENLNEKGESIPNSSEIRYIARRKDTVNQDNTKRNTNHKRKPYNGVASKHTTNSKEANSREEEADSSESNVPMPRPNKYTSKRKEPMYQPRRAPKYSAKNKNIDRRHDIDQNSNSNTVSKPETSDYTDMNRIKNAQAPNMYDPIIRNKPLDNSELRGQTPASQNDAKNTVVQEQIETAQSHAKAKQISDQNRVVSIQELFRNTPNAAYNPNGALNLSTQNQIQDQKGVPPGNIPIQMVPYPYALPTFFINNKLDGSLSQSNTPNANVAAYNAYNGAAGYSVKNSIGIAQEQIGGANNPSVPGFPNALHYSRKSNTGTSQDQINVAANSRNNPNPIGYQGAPNYSAQSNIGSNRETIGGNIEHSNPVAVYPNTPYYSDRNKPGETRDAMSSSINAINKNAHANSPHVPSNYSTNNKIGGIQEQIPAVPLYNPNPFGSIISAKEKFPVIQDSRIETLLKNANINAGLSFNPYITYPANNQAPMAASVQNPYLQRQDVTGPNLAPNNFDMQNRQLSLPNQPLLYRERQDIISPVLALNSNKDAILSINAQYSPYTNSQQVTALPHREKTRIEASEHGSDDAISFKLKETPTVQSSFHLPESTNIVKLNELSKKRHEKVVQKTPIMMQTNDDEIMPLGIPIHIRGESKFHMRLIQNQHIIVTTTSRPRSRIDQWNHYVLAKDARTKQETEEKKSRLLATYHPQERVRPPMTHHDFEDLPPIHEPSNYYHEDLNNMRPRTELEFESRHMHQYSTEVLPKRLYYNPEIQEEGYARHRSDQPEKVSLFRNQERMHDSINTGHLTIAQRHQVPLKRPQVNFDDTHFQNFLKTQEKVNEMLERILATRPKNLSLDPFKNS